MCKALLKAVSGIIGILLLVACAQHVRLSGNDDLPAKPPLALRVATLNVHYILLKKPTGAWSVADWERRKPALDSAFKHVSADLFAFQEMESFLRGSDGSINLARDWIAERNPGYALAAHGPWRTFPPTQPIFYRTDRIEMLKQGWFFFSDTPDVIYSRTFNGSYPAFASWARFADRLTGSEFVAVNVHFEYRSATNRRLSAELVQQRIKPWVAEGVPVLLLGDLNARIGSDTTDTLEEGGLTFASVQGASYHFNRGINLFAAIDHIGHTEDFSLIAEPHVVRRKFAGTWPSDHYPVVADFHLADRD